MSHMTHFGDQLTKHLESVGISPYRLAIETKQSSSLVYKVINGQRLPSDGFIDALAKYKELKANEGLLKQWRATDEYPELAQLLDSPPAYGMSDTVSVPRYEHCPAGPGLFMDEPEVLDQFPVPKKNCPNPRGSYAVIIKGHSMKGVVNDGSTIVVDTEAMTKTGDVVLAWVNGECTCKRLADRADGLWLEPANKRFKAFKVDDDTVFHKVVYAAQPL